MFLNATCHCGACRIGLPCPPTTLTNCNCSLCRRYGALWAYYDPAVVDLSGLGPTDTYAWDRQTLDVHRCRDCGNITHWRARGDRPDDRLGVNARLLPLEVQEAARIRRLDGAVTERYLDG